MGQGAGGGGELGWSRVWEEVSGVGQGVGGGEWGGGRV